MSYIEYLSVKAIAGFRGIKYGGLEDQITSTNHSMQKDQNLKRKKRYM